MEPCNILYHFFLYLNSFPCEFFLRILLIFIDLKLLTVFNNSLINKKIIDLKTALLNEAGLERNRFYFCRSVVANARAIYRLSVSVSDYILCIAWV